MRDILCHFSPSLSLPLTPPLSFTLSVCTSLSLLVYYVSCHTSLFLCVFLYIWFMEPNRTHHPYVWSLFLFLYCTFYCCPSATFSCHSSPPLPLFSYGSNNAIQEVLMQHHANCQGAPTGGLSPALGYGTESNLTGVTEVRLECSHFSTSANFVHINGLRVTPSKIRAGWRLTGATVFHTVCFLFFFLKFRLHF